MKCQTVEGDLVQALSVVYDWTEEPEASSGEGALSCLPVFV